MGIVALKGIEIAGRIGVADEEHQLGRHFIVDVEVRYPLAPAADTDDIKHTLNYADILTAVYAHMAKDYKLMEAAARGITVDLLQKYPTIEKMKIRIEKKRPFLPGHIHSSWIEWNYPEDYIRSK